MCSRIALIMKIHPMSFCAYLTEGMTRRKSRIHIIQTKRPQIQHYSNISNTMHMHMQPTPCAHNLMDKRLQCLRTYENRTISVGLWNFIRIELLRMAYSLSDLQPTHPRYSDIAPIAPVYPRCFAPYRSRYPLSSYFPYPLD